MALELESLQGAIRSLESAIGVVRQKQDPGSGTSAAELEVIRAGVIQSFEFTYELCWKFMKRWLEDNIGSAYVDGVP